MTSADSRPSSPPSGDGDLPRVSPRLFALFARYSRWYLGRNFHAVRRSGPLPRVPAHSALVVYFNHPAWWDPLLALLLAREVFGERSHYGPIDAAALESYGFFRRLGFFGVQPGTVTGARRFLRVSGELLKRPGTALWITPEGRFTDPRQRPVRLRPGLGRLAGRLADRPGGAVLVPLALEYPFWEERFPEALLRFGEPVDVGREIARRQRVGQGEPSARDWDHLLAGRLETVQDELAEVAVARDPDAFTTLVGGRAGIGGLYDLWRSLRAALRGERFDPEHAAVTRDGEPKGGQQGSSEGGGGPRNGGERHDTDRNGDGDGGPLGPRRWEGGRR